MADTTFLELRSRFVYGVEGAETDWATRLPVRPWDRRTATVGGVRIAATGIPASYVVRRDHILRLTLRLFESEWADALGLIEWGQAAEAFRWYPDALSALHSAVVWLQSPAAGEDVQPTRSTEYPQVLELPLELRTVSAAPWITDYYDTGGTTA